MPQGNIKQWFGVRGCFAVERRNAVPLHRLVVYVLDASSLLPCRGFLMCVCVRAF